MFDRIMLKLAGSMRLRSSSIESIKVVKCAEVGMVKGGASYPLNNYYCRHIFLISKSSYCFTTDSLSTEQFNKLRRPLLQKEI